MATKQRKVDVVLGGDASGLSAAMQKAVKESKSSAKTIGDSFKSVDGSGFLDKIQAKAKAMRLERRVSGETALESLIRDPTTALGVQGFAADYVGKAFAKTTGTMLKFQNADENGGIPKLVTELAYGLPVLGGWVEGWSNVLELITGASREMAALNRNVQASLDGAAAIGRLNVVGDRVKLLQAGFDSPNAVRLESLNQEHQAKIKASNEAKAKLDAKADEYANSHLDYEDRLRMKFPDSWQTQAQRDHVTATLNANRKIFEQEHKTEYDALATERKKLDEEDALRKKQAAKDYFNNLQNTKLGLLGAESSLLTSAQSQPGGNTFAAQRMQKLLSAYEWGTSETQKLRAIIDGDGTQEQKDAAKAALKQVAHRMDYLTGSKYLDQHDYIPLRFAGAEDVGSSYTGAAQVAMQKDMADSSGDFLANQKEANDLLTSIDANIAKILNVGAGVPVLP